MEILELISGSIPAKTEHDLSSSHLEEPSFWGITLPFAPGKLSERESSQRGCAESSFPLPSSRSPGLVFVGVYG